MPTPSRVVTVEVLINDQALSTQDPQGAITHSAICPLLGLLLLHQLHLNARWPSSLPVQVLLISNAHPCPAKRVHKLILRRGNTESCSEGLRAAEQRHPCDICDSSNQMHVFVLYFTWSRWLSLGKCYVFVY